MVPYIVIFDIDGTLIGDISPQVLYYDIIQELKEHKVSLSPIDNNDFIYKLKNGIIRPHFMDFVHSIQNQLGNVEFFIYTASQNKWALSLVKLIEKALGITFNRPIFTRKDCIIIDNSYKKSITKIYGRIFNALKKKYHGLSKADLNNHLIMIDNNNVFLQNEDTNLILCPTYNQRFPENIPAKIKQEHYLKYHKMIHNILTRYIQNFPLTSNYLRFQKYYYQIYVEQLKSMGKEQDTFFLKLRDIFLRKDIKTFDKKTLIYINSKISLN